MAKEHIGKEELELVPCSPSAKGFPKFSSNPNAVPIKVLQERPTESQEPSLQFCNPDFKLPTLTKAAVAAPEDATAVAVASRSEKTYDFNFGGTESIHFYWVCRG